MEERDSADLGPFEAAAATAGSKPFNQLLARAALVKFGQLTEEELRKSLDAFYRQLEVESCKREINLERIRQQLDRPGSYKTDILGLDGDSSSNLHRGPFDFWSRRFGILRHLGIRSDVLIMRAGEQVPPHGHSQVVSGFYMLEGRVAVRHYDRIQPFPRHVLLRNVIDSSFGPGGYTTNSEYYQNIHWLLGLAPVSYLFRFTVTDVPVRRFDASKHLGSRIYVDPTVTPEASGLIPAPYITYQEAKKVRFEHERECV